MVLPGDVLRGVLPQLYVDLVQPAAKQVGEAMGSAAKTARFAIAPVEYLAAQHDRWIRYLQRLAEEVPEERMVKAPPEVAGPILSRLQYCEENGILAEMFLRLLARAIDRERIHEAHPAFASIIGQLSPDEAVILLLLKSNQFYYRKQSITLHLPMSRQNLASTSQTDFPREQIIFPDNVDLYVEHLHHLNLIVGGRLDLPLSTQSFGHPVDQSALGVVRHEYVYDEEVRLSEFGKMFARACIPDAWPSANVARSDVEAGQGSGSIAEGGQ